MTAHVHVPVQNVRHNIPVPEWFCGECLERLPGPTTDPLTDLLDTAMGEGLVLPTVVELVAAIPPDKADAMRAALVALAEKEKEADR